ncbi:MAG: sulfotransferase family 2 domain-containing protein [Verrucomicrobia bacterium]|nr:sulfotransferase family 2 domain-containing protein [Verrucomicrobiota bacterium]MDA1069153.1 sulfotransferase family 2 domain-containing protein [Verrucomicrobiota bacterium]
MLKKVIFYSLPYSMRRKLFSIVKRHQFEEMQHLRTVVGEDGRSLKPFDQHQCILVHIPKTAGVSVCQSLFGNLAGSHKTLIEYQKIFSKTDFNRYFKFTFVRNPWDRLFSAYNFLKNGGMNQSDKRWAEKHIAPYESFDTFVKNGLQRPGIRKWIHFKPQSDFLYIPRDPKLHMNFFGYFENLQNDFRYVVNKLDLNKHVFLQHKNAGNTVNKLDYKDFYSNKSRAIVSEFYKSDIKNFGYNFDNSSLEEQLQNRLRQ